MNSSFNLWVVNGSTTETPSGQIVYELATPIPLSLTGQQIQTLLGENVVWGNGEIEIEYSADLKHYIDSKIAAAVAAMN
jgi:hypothetical protein